MRRLGAFFLAVLLFLLVTGATSWKTARNDLETQVATGSSALSTTLAPGIAFKLVEVRLHLSAASATSENFTATMDAAAGSAYDVVLLAKDMNGVADYVYTFEVNRYFTDLDELDFAWTNTNSRTYGLEVVYEIFN